MLAGPQKNEATAFCTAQRKKVTAGFNRTVKQLVAKHIYASEEENGDEGEEEDEVDRMVRASSHTCPAPPQDPPLRPLCAPPSPPTPSPPTPRPSLPTSRPCPHLSAPPRLCAWQEDMRLELFTPEEGAPAKDPGAKFPFCLMLFSIGVDSNGSDLPYDFPSVPLGNLASDLARSCNEAMSKEMLALAVAVVHCLRKQKKAAQNKKPDVGEETWEPLMEWKMPDHQVCSRLPASASPPHVSRALPRACLCLHAPQHLLRRCPAAAPPAHRNSRPRWPRRCSGWATTPSAPLGTHPHPLNHTLACPSSHVHSRARARRAHDDAQ